MLDYVLAIPALNFITLSASLLSIWIFFPVRLIMEGVLGETHKCNAMMTRIEM